jgi:hypothetical protein
MSRLSAVYQLRLAQERLPQYSTAELSAEALQRKGKVYREDDRGVLHIEVHIVSLSVSILIDMYYVAMDHLLHKGDPCTMRTM